MASDIPKRERPAKDAAPSPPRPADPESTAETLSPGAPPSASGASPRGTYWAHLRLIEEIGRGGFGRVYRAWDQTLAREVALKLVGGTDFDEESAAGFLNEGRMLARVRHANIVTIYGAQRVGSEIGLWMELVRGRSLAAGIERDGPLGADEAAVIGLSVARALAAVHAAGLVHRDVKAQNVMRESGGRIVLMDFGAGRELTSADPSVTTGTPLYMAPEVIAGQPASPASDIYSLGVLLYFLVTAKYPVEGQSLVGLALEHSRGRRRLLADVRPDLPERFIVAVERAIATNPEERYATAGALIRDLGDLARVEQPVRRESEPASPRGPARPRSRRTPGGRPPPPRAVEPSPAIPPRPPSRAPSGPGPVVTAIAAVLGGVWVLGFINSMAFNLTLGRPLPFSGESPLSWWMWGLRSLVAPVVYMMMAVTGWFVVRSAWRLARRLSAVPDARVRRWSASLLQVARRVGIADLDSRSQLLVGAQVVALGIVGWRFWPLISATMAYINDADSASLAALSPGHALQHLYYGLALDLIILVTAAAWYRIVKTRKAAGQRLFDVTTTAGICLVALSIFALELPYRLMWQADFERVQYSASRCYLIGERAQQALVYCPDAPSPRNRVVSLSDPQLHRLGVFENIFTPSGAVGQ